MLQPQHKHPPPHVFLLFYFYWHFHVESRRALLTVSLSSSPPLVLSTWCFIPSVPYWESLLVLETAPAQPVTQQTLVTHVKMMRWKKTDVKQINKDSQHWSMWLQQCCIWFTAKQHAALCFKLWVYKHQSWISNKLNQRLRLPWMCVHADTQKKGEKKWQDACRAT